MDFVVRHRLECRIVKQEKRRRDYLEALLTFFFFFFPPAPSPFANNKVA